MVWRCREFFFSKILVFFFIFFDQFFSIIFFLLGIFVFEFYFSMFVVFDVFSDFIFYVFSREKYQNSFLIKCPPTPPGVLKRVRASRFTLSLSPSQTGSKSRKKICTHPPPRGGGCVQISRIWIPSGRGKGRG